ncbi:hypothetical protein MY10362_004785 [Beauveria mimosiformis]
MDAYCRLACHRLNDDLLYAQAHQRARVPAQRPKIRRPNRHGVVLASPSTAASQFCAAPLGLVPRRPSDPAAACSPDSVGSSLFFLILPLSSAAQDRLIHAFLRAGLGTGLRPGQRPGSLGMKLSG